MCSNCVQNQNWKCGKNARRHRLTFCFHTCEKREDHPGFKRHVVFLNFSKNNLFAAFHDLKLFVIQNHNIFGRHNLCLPKILWFWITNNMPHKTINNLLWKYKWTLDWRWLITYEPWSNVRKINGVWKDGNGEGRNFRVRERQDWHTCAYFAKVFIILFYVLKSLAFNPGLWEEIARDSEIVECRW